ncbi:MAG: hypothetical protein IJZ70_03685 [Bacteroidales bacterium]|nr:hypothetical protein [Bacteroidales bacterium]
MSADGSLRTAVAKAGILPLWGLIGIDQLESFPNSSEASYEREEGVSLLIPYAHQGKSSDNLLDRSLDRAFCTDERRTVCRNRT